MRIVSIIAIATTLIAGTASAEQILADYGLDESVQAEADSFTDIAAAMEQVQETSNAGLALFARYADTRKLDDETRQAMQQWESLASLTWLQFNAAVAGAQSLIDQRIDTHCDEAAFNAELCLDAYDDRIKFSAWQVKILQGMQGFDMVQTGIGEVLN